MSNEFNEDQQKCSFFAAYIRSKRNAIILSGIFIIILSGIFFLYNVNLDAIVFASIICTITVAIYIILDFPKFHQHLNALKHATSNITLTLGSLPSSENDTYKAYENLYEYSMKVEVNSSLKISPQNDIWKIIMLCGYIR